MSKKLPRSKRLLHKAIINLLNEKDLSLISVKELIIEADINRSTFYVNYSNKEELIEEIIDDLMLKIRKQLDKPFLNEKKEGYYENIYLELIGLFELIYNERNLIEALLRLEAKFNFRVLIYEEIIYNAKNNLVYHQSEGVPVDLDLYNHYSNSALVGAIFYWIGTGFQLTPEELSIELTKISKNPPFKYTYKE